MPATIRLLLRASPPEDEAVHGLHAGLRLALGYLWLEAGGVMTELPNEDPFLRARAEDLGSEAAAPPGLLSAWSPDEDFAAGLELLVVDPSRCSAAQPPRDPTPGDGPR